MTLRSEYHTLCNDRSDSTSKRALKTDVLSAELPPVMKVLLCLVAVGLSAHVFAQSDDDHTAQPVSDEESSQNDDQFLRDVGQSATSLSNRPLRQAVSFSPNLPSPRLANAD